MRRRRYSRLLVWVLLGSVLFCVGYIAYYRILLRVYPIRYGNIIESYSNQVGVDPFLVASLIRIESGFDSTAVSTKGAMGLMQIVPTTGHWIAGRIGIERYKTSMLFEPVVNIRMGIWYISQLQQEFGDSLPAIAAYNAGRGNVRGWLASGKWNGTIGGLDDLPFRETRVYIRRVLNAYNWYKRVYRKGWPDN